MASFWLSNTYLSKARGEPFLDHMIYAGLDKEALERLSLGGNLKPAAPDIMDVDQAAAYMGFAPRTIYNLAQAGEMPAAKVKGSWRFSKAALDAWIAELSQANMRKERD
jgi:excisionase family DNA binding protein